MRVVTQTLHTKSSRPSSPHHPLGRPPPHARVCRRRCLCDWTYSDHVDEEIPFVTNSSAFLVQTDEGAVNPVVDQIRRSTAAYR
ncbi:MICROTUBULE ORGANIZATION 1 family protein [Dorcoceras hygrometricum]|uniref:MICROTUBULE ORGANIZATION 1 family protein n=1 Tax=Dorcoceras hygrometricum TaxID=472368 RepID=A0A2Z7D940_9LAMI|nr:MICROTUBULE ORGANIZATION 1 family protein [Dorcoceras hygrometricum]